MKPLIIAVFIAVIVGGIAMNRDWGSSATYQAPQDPVTVEKEVEVDYIAKAVEDAQEAKLSEIEAIAQEAYDASYEHEMKKIELEVRQQLQAEHEATITELEKEVGVY